MMRRVPARRGPATGCASPPHRSGPPGAGPLLRAGPRPPRISRNPKEDGHDHLNRHREAARPPAPFAQPHPAPDRRRQRHPHVSLPPFQKLEIKTEPVRPKRRL